VLFYLFVLPKTMTTAILFATGLGLTGDATVSPTSGILSGHFPLHQVATLMGLLFFAHQIGGFLSAYLGGLSYQLFGNYTLIWLIDIILCLVASLASYLIREK
jgi:MFS transporter